MIIIGAKGFAKELLDVCHELDMIEGLTFFDNKSDDIQDKLFGEFPIIRSLEEVSSFFQSNGNQYSLGIGGPKIRKKLHEQFDQIGGVMTSIISPRSSIGKYSVEIENGCTILGQSTIANGTKIGKGCLVYHHAQITHDCQIGDFVEISPNAVLLGGVHVGNCVSIGANATILPGLTIGDNAIIGAGAVVTKNVLSNKKVKGVPAK